MKKVSLLKTAFCSRAGTPVRCRMPMDRHSRKWKALAGSWITLLLCLTWSAPAFAQIQARLAHPHKARTEHQATYYHNKFEKRKTATGEIFSQRKYTAAHKTLPFDTLVKVTNKTNGRSVLVKINDRCRDKNSIDMSLAAAKKIAMHKAGRSKVTVEIVGDEYRSAWAKQGEGH